MKGYREARVGCIGQQNYAMVAQMIAEGKTASHISDILQVAPETIRKFARKRGLTIVRQDVGKENHPCWRGGITYDRRGYKLIRVDRDGEFGYLIRANTRNDLRGYAPEHRVVMHKKLGRRLEVGEVVDHIDGDVRNNHPDNLRVFASNALHLATTSKGKCPNWSPEGFARFQKANHDRWLLAAQRKHRMP